MAKMDWQHAHKRTKPTAPMTSDGREARAWLAKHDPQQTSARWQARAEARSALPMTVPLGGIGQAKTERGGWTRETLAKWGVAWPPPRGWKRALLSGELIPRGTPGSKNDVDVDHRALLEQVVM